MTFFKTSVRMAALAAGLAATSAMAQSPAGVWIDHTGRGAVEIAECAGGLCGHVVWVKDGKNKSACRTQIIGNAKQVGPGTWDRGWIFDPDSNSRYSVELKPIGNDRLRVMGYMGSKLFSETMTWKRAPDNLPRCDGKETAKVDAPPQGPAPGPAQAAPAITPPQQPAAAVPAAPEVTTAAPQPDPTDVPPAQVVDPRRQAAPIVVPGAPTEPRTAQAPAAEANPLETPPARTAETHRQRPSSGKRKSASRECKLDVGYIVVKFPCDAF